MDWTLFIKLAALMTLSVGIGCAGAAAIDSVRRRAAARSEERAA